MEKSDNIGNLAAALSALQGKLTDVHKDQQAYGYKYANLTQVLELVRPLLAAHGLALIQIPGNADEKVSIQTMLMHSKSGEWISGTLDMPVTVGKGMSPAQAVGSVISYARRYSITSWLGISQSDNDAAETAEPEKAFPISESQINQILDLLDHNGDRLQAMYTHLKIKDIHELKYDQAMELIKSITASNAKKANETKETEKK